MYAGAFNDPENATDKRVTVMNKNSEIYGACRHKTTFRRFSLTLMILFLTGESISTLKGFSNLMT